MDAEVWKICLVDPNFSVSSLGRVKNRKTDRVLRQTPSGPGYLTVSMAGKQHAVHRLVYQAFVSEDLQPRQHLRHINDDLTDNRPGNLFLLGGVRRGYIKTGNPPGRPKKKVLVEETGEVYESQIACAEALGVRTSFVNNVLRGRSNTVRGMHLRYVTE